MDCDGGDDGGLDGSSDREGTPPRLGDRLGCTDWDGFELGLWLVVWPPLGVADVLGVLLIDGDFDGEGDGIALRLGTAATGPIVGIGVGSKWTSCTWGASAPNEISKND